MNVNIRVSVVIPTYNRIEKLLKTIASIQRQTYENIEIVIVDDGSTDDTVTTLKDLNLPNVKLIAQSNTGQTRARKNGVEKASGDIIFLCDSDDIWTKRHVENHVMAYEASPQVAYAFSNFREFGSSARYINKFSSAPTHTPFSQIDSMQTTLTITPDTATSLCDFSPIFPSCLSFKRECLPFVDDIPDFILAASIPAEDWFFTLRLASQKVGVGITERTVLIRKDGENHSGNNVANLIGEIRILESFNERYAHHPNKIEDAIESRRQQVLVNAFTHRDKEVFMNHFNAAKASPKDWLKMCMLKIGL